MINSTLEDFDLTDPILKPKEEKKSNQKFHFFRCILVLYKRQFYTKFRTKTALFEIIFSLFLPFWILIISQVGHVDIEGSLNPDYDEHFKLGEDLGTFLAISKKATGSAKFFILPKNEKTEFLAKELFGDFSAFSVQIQYCDTIEEMKDRIYKTDNNGVGIHWINSNETDAEYNPIIEVYLQSMYGDPSQDLFRITRSVIARKHKRYSLAKSDSYVKRFAEPTIKLSVDLNMTLMIFSIWPVFFSATPDAQAVLDDRGLKVFTLMKLMGCPETAYWIVSFTTSLFMSIFPYIVHCFIVCYGAGLVGSSFWFILSLSFLFIISHICFLFFLVSLAKKPVHGRMFIIVFLLVSIFSCFAHHYFTLDENNYIPISKDIFSIIPFSAWQLLLADLVTKQNKYERPMSWNDFNLDSTYPISKGVYWLSFDAFLYFILFLFFNAVVSRPTGQPPLGWRGLFSLSKWKKLFRRNRRKFGSSMNNFDCPDMLSVSNLSKTYEGVTTTKALDDVNFSIKKGEIVIVIGPNGAGKSTLINILSGTLEPTEGSLQIFGTNTTDFSDLSDYLGICFQEDVIISTMTLRQNIELFATFRGLTKNEINHFISKHSSSLQLDHVLDSYAKDLSGGQKRKLCILISFLGNPPLIIMDEPAAGVDVQSRINIWKVISQLKDTSVMITSHALDEAEAICQRIMIVSKGRIPFAGTSTELRKQYKCGYILRLEPKIGCELTCLESVLDLIHNIIPEASPSDDVSNSIRIPVCDEVDVVLDMIDHKKEELGILTYSFSVEHLEDMLIKMIQSDEAALHI